jgi:O-antigen ligase
MYAVLGVVGSAYSVIVIGACLYTLARLPYNLNLIQIPPAYKIISVLGLLYYVSGALIVMRNTGDAKLLVERLPFLFFLPVLMQLSLTDSFELARALKKGCLLAGIAIGAWLLVNFYNGGGRASGGSGNPGPFATTCVFVASVNFAAFFEESNSKRNLFLLSGVLALAGIMASGMRLFLPILFVAPVMFAIVYRKSLFGDKSHYTKVLFIFGVVIAITLAIFFLSPRLIDLFHTLQTQGLVPSASTSLGQRIAMWKCAAQTIPNNWLLGLGIDSSTNFMKACSYNLVGLKFGHTHFHNFITTALLQGGIVELLAVSLLIFIPLVTIVRAFRTLWIYETRRFAFSVWIIMLIAFLLQGLINSLFGHDIHDMLFIHASCVLMAIFFATREDIDNEDD